MGDLFDVAAETPEAAVLPLAAVAIGGDHHQASRFEKLAPAQALKARVADSVKPDIAALEQEYGFAVSARTERSVLDRLLRR